MSRPSPLPAAPDPTAAPATAHPPQTSAPEGLLDGVPVSLPALMQAQDISRKAVSAGFEWPDVASVWDQVASEIEEYRAEPVGSARAAEEFGDVLFSLVNVARKEGIDAESALRSTCRKFRDRWAIMEQDAQKAGNHISAYSTDELEEMWRSAKAVEAGAVAGATNAVKAAETGETTKAAKAAKTAKAANTIEA